MTFLGADVGELRALAKQFSEAGAQLTSAKGAVTGQVQSSPWRGPDAEGFREDWGGRYSGQLVAAARLLEQGAAALVRNADEQEGASSDDGGGSTGASGVGGTGSGGTGAGGTGGTGSGDDATGPLPPVPADDASTDDVRDWWDSLSPEEQQRYIDENPGLIGQLDGIPFSVRDEANRAYLESELERLQSLPVPSDPGEAAELQRAIDVLENAETVLAENPDTHLLLLDTGSGDPVKIAISVGDVDTADNVGVYTQGMNSRADTPGGLSGPLADMAAIQAAIGDQNEQLGTDETSAMVVWMGYDSPQWAEAAIPTNGIDGSDDLARFGEGIRSVNGDTHLTAIGHSYGSFVTGLALQQTSAFDDAVVFGSPGLGTSDVGDLQTGSGELYVLEADRDPVADLGAFGTDPNQLPGATNLSADGTGQYGQSYGHSEYLIGESTSQYNIAAVVGGNQDRVITGDNSGLGDVLRGSLYGAIDVPRNIADSVVEAGVTTGRYLRWGWEALF
ncbi:alpha/beta hydrolase [Herbiconiux sp. P15]|uniref:alpha/beta hydrolase n=1 Tax=Herbiconiux liukaitaii TaxID=3342799 RepID=UPI0035BA51D5